MKKYLLLITGLCLFQFGCVQKKEYERAKKQNDRLRNRIDALESEVKDLKEPGERLKFLSSKIRGVKARIKTNYGDMEVKFYENIAPIHCFNFITRAEGGFYDKTQFHRIIPGFMIQGGDPNTKDKDPYNDGQGGPIVHIPHEFNSIHHRPGILSMARTKDKNAGAGSQFYIMHGDKSHLDNEYTAFGEVTKGMDVVDKIAKVETNKKDPKLQNSPSKPVIIKTIEVYR
jgi:peptidyl-prolyl cis-trans isomerase B (cyclophilin B)